MRACEAATVEVAIVRRFSWRSCCPSIAAALRRMRSENLDDVRQGSARIGKPSPRNCGVARRATITPHVRPMAAQVPSDVSGPLANIPADGSAFLL
jgi:hypothetical protein